MRKVKRGEPIEISASTWNSFIDAATFINKIATNMSGSGNILSGIGQGIILIKNSLGKDLEQFSAVHLSDIATISSDSANKDSKPFTASFPCLNTKTPDSTTTTEPYVITLEPIKSDSVGRAIAFGLVVARVSIVDASHQYAGPTTSGDCKLESKSSGTTRILWKSGSSDVQWAFLLLGAGGSVANSDVVICKTTGDLNGIGYKVNLYENGIHERYTSKGELFVPELALGSRLPDDTFIVGHKCFTIITGGNDE